MLQPRPIDPHRDLPAVAELLGRTRAGGGLSHPGGIQWWLRELWREDRDDFGAFAWDRGGAMSGFALVDGTFVIVEHLDGGPAALEQLAWLEGRLRDDGRPAIDVHLAERDPLLPALEERGYASVGSELELIAATAMEPVVPALPDGYAFASLLDVSDDAFVDGHRAAWSDNRPSPYKRELHAAVRSMPQFRPDLVTIVLAADGVVASSCIGWFDATSRTLEIEPLGTHRDHRRRGLAHAVVKEVQHRAWAAGAKQVLVWNDPDTNPAAFGLYTGADMPPTRRLIGLHKALRSTE